MKKIRLTETELTNIIKRVIKEDDSICVTQNFTTDDGEKGTFCRGGNFMIFTMGNEKTRYTKSV